jgi:hypothetical protein
MTAFKEGEYPVQIAANTPLFLSREHPHVTLHTINEQNSASDRPTTNASGMVGCKRRRPGRKGSDKF